MRTRRRSRPCSRTPAPTSTPTIWCARSTSRAARQPAAGAARRDAPPRLHPVCARSPRRARSLPSSPHAARCSSCRTWGSIARPCGTTRSSSASMATMSSSARAPSSGASSAARASCARGNAARTGRSSPCSPATLPATATAGAYVRALAGAEPLLVRAAAERGYRAALERWPSDELVLFAAAGQRHGAGDLAGATALYRRLLGSRAAARSGPQQPRERPRRARLPRAGDRRGARRARRASSRAMSSPHAVRDTVAEIEQPPRRVRGRRRAASDASAMTAGKTEAQTAGAVLMIRPAHFGSNAETAGSNFFQRSAPGLARRRATRATRVRRAGARARRRRSARASVRGSTRRRRCPTRCFRTTG